jgi:sugar phosphate isomerase/epimerase
VPLNVQTNTTDLAAKRLRLGAAGLTPRDPADLTPDRARGLIDLGVRRLCTHFPLGTMTVDDATRVREILDDAGLSIAQAAGFRTNLVLPDDQARRSGIGELDDVLGVARALGADMFITGCGSLNPAGFYAPHPDNHLPQTRHRLIDSLRQAAPIAADHEMILALECHQLTTLDTPEHIRDILDEVDSPWIKANFDPVNLLDALPAVYNSGTAMRHMHQTIGHHYTNTAHLKDVTVNLTLPLHLSETIPGDGYLDLPTFMQICTELGDDTTVIVEHLATDEQIVAAIKRAREAAADAGVTFAS